MSVQFRDHLPKRKLEQISVHESIAPTTLTATAAGTTRKFELKRFRNTMLNDVWAKIDTLKHLTGGTGYTFNLYVDFLTPEGTVSRAVTRQITTTTTNIATSLQLFPSVADHLAVNSTGASVATSASDDAGIYSPVDTNSTGTVARNTASNLQVPVLNLPHSKSFSSFAIGFEIGAGASTGDFVLDMDVFAAVDELTTTSFPTVGISDDKGSALIVADGDFNIVVPTSTGTAFGQARS
jgi:hypothetical protein